MSTHQKTLKIVTNLDRAAVERKLAALRDVARAEGLDEVATLLSGCEGAPRARLEQSVRAALRSLGTQAGHAEVKAQLELVELNLPNL